MIVLLDVDGTLVDYTAKLPASAADAVRAARAAGHSIYLCTGRSRAEIYPELWDLGLDGLIGGNGSYVESRGVVVHHQVLDPSTVDRAVGWLVEQRLPFYVECNSGLFGTDDLIVAVAGLFEGGASEATIELVRTGMPHLIVGAITPGAPWRTDVNKISFVLRDGVDLDALARTFAGASAIDTWSLTGRGPEFGEFGQIGVHKGVAVRRLAEHVGVGASELIGFGDARSDLELLAACGTGVAMGQSPNELKAVATLVTASVNEDGLAKAFVQLGLIAAAAVKL